MTTDEDDGRQWAYDQDDDFSFQVGRPHLLEWRKADGGTGSSMLTKYSLELPHQCEEWCIAISADRAFVIAAAKRFRAGLDRAIASLEGESPGSSEGGPDGAADPEAQHAPQRGGH